MSIVRQTARRLGVVIMSVRGHAKRLLPPSLHRHAGRTGRALIRSLDRLAGGGRAPAWMALPAADRSGGRHRIVHVSDGVQQGGAERQLVNLLNALQDSGRAPHLITFHLKDGQDFFADRLRRAEIEHRDALPHAEAIETLRHAFGEEMVRGIGAALDWAPGDVQRDILRLVAEFVRATPAVVHGWQDRAGLVAAIGALIAGVPRVILATRNVNPTHFEYYRPWMRAAYIRLTQEPSVILINNSEAGARDYERWLGVARGTFIVVRNGVAAEGVAPPDATAKLDKRRAIDLPADAPVIGGLFRWQAEKRPLLWIDVAQRVARRRPQARFVLAGGGALEAQMRALTQRFRLGDRISLLDRTNAPLDILSTFDVLLSTSAQEGTPNVILEAGLVGVPVVATDAGGSAEAMLPGKTGVIVRADIGAEESALADKLAAAVLSVLDDGAMAAEARRMGPEFVRDRFGVQRMLESTLELYRR